MESDVLVVCQMGAEGVKGTAVAANKRFRDLSVSFDPQLLVKFYRAYGRRWATTGVKHREWSVGRVETDVAGFNSLTYPLVGCFGGAVTPIGVTGGHTWAIAPNPAGLDAYKTFTIKDGIPGSWANAIAYGGFLSFNLNFGQDAISFNGDIIGRKIDMASSLDAATDVPEAPLSFSRLTWFIDNTYGGIGTTEWTHVFEGGVSIPRLREPVFVQRQSVSSFDGLSESDASESFLTLTAMYNAQTRGFVDAQRADSLPVRYIQALLNGDNIGVGADYLLKSNFAVKLEGATPRRNVQGVYAYDFRYRLLDDVTMGRPLEFTLINKVAAL